MQIYDITIATNSSRRLDAPGTYFYYYSGSAGGADNTITLQGASSGLRIVLKPGQSMRLPEGASVETSWIVGNSANAATIIGTVIVGSGTIQDNRIQGSVEVVDGGKNRTMSGAAFSGYVYCAPVAAQYSHGQIYNPSSTRILVIEQIIVSSSTSANLTIRAHSSAFSTPGAQPNASSKRLGNADSIAQLYTANNAAQQATGKYFSNMGITAPGTAIYKMSEPIVITPGQSIVAINNTLNADLSVTYEFYEDVI